VYLNYLFTNVNFPHCLEQGKRKFGINSNWQKDNRRPTVKGGPKQAISLTLARPKPLGNQSLRTRCLGHLDLPHSAACGNNSKFQDKQKQTCGE